MRYYYLILTLWMVLGGGAFAQRIAAPDPDSVRMASVERKLAQVAAVDSSYRGEVDISVGKIALPDMLRNVAKVGGVNLSVKGAEKVMVTCNFTRARITDLLAFLCREYDLDISVAGNIVSVFPAGPVPQPAKEMKMSYDIGSGTLSYDLSDEPLTAVMKKITALTGTNVIVPQSLYSRQVSGFVNGMGLDDAIQILADVNLLDAEKTKAGVWMFSEPVTDPKGGRQPSVPAFVRKQQYGPNQLKVDSLGRITAQIAKGSVQDIILDLCQQMKLNYFFVTPISQQTAVFVRDVDFDTLLGIILAGTNYSWYRENDIFIFGTSGKEATLASTRVIRMEYRSVDKVADLIPASIKGGLQIQQFGDQNSLIVCGDQKLVGRVEAFLRSIDKSVPLVTMEIMIVDATKSNIMEAGISLGIGQAPVKTTGTLSPGVDMMLGAASVNKLINSFNGFGSVNLGKVGADFYMGLKLLEDNGVIELHSTPKLSTLNGHEATMKSGETKYYKEVLNNIIGTQNPIQSESFTWKSVEANLSIRIVPFVSGNDQITMEVEIEQSEFTAREEKEAPPGTASRNFKSLVRVQNEDMVLLGGIDRNSREKSTSGLPFIARVPVLKWIFGKTKDNKVDHKLNIFIKPTIIF